MPAVALFLGWLLSIFLPSKDMNLIMLLIFIADGLVAGFVPTVIEVILHPSTYIFTAASISTRYAKLRRIFFYYSWQSISGMIDQGDAEVKVPVIEKAKGIVLEVGAGLGVNIKYYKRDQVKKLIVVEPNLAMHPLLLGEANKHEYFEENGSLLLLGCGGAASDEKALAAAGVVANSIDTVACIHVLCGIPEPLSAIEMYKRLLKPGGMRLWWEHVRSSHLGTAKWQALYTKLFWSTFLDGCVLNRPTGGYIIHGASGGADVAYSSSKEALTTGDAVRGSRRWAEYELTVPQREVENPYGMTPHIIGWAIKTRRNTHVEAYIACLL